jgi:UDP-N-acetylglucosamine--N-acetylmuramyl-(pentapeptide) pyrophosphoryl-undecaprenol N-acetylglucosamine transferase
MMRLALTAGGTGGHIIPALVVMDAVRAHAETAPEVRFFGPEDRGERQMVEARGLRFEAVPAAAVRGRGPVRIAKGVARLAQGTIIATRKLHAFNPDVVFSTGGYGSFPCSVASRLLRRPLVVYLPDVSPGWAVRVETRLATRMATTTEAALDRLPKAKTTVSGYPVRPTFFTQTRAEARTALGLSEDERVLLIAGATQGSQAINRAVFSGIERMSGVATVFHITGPGDFEAANERSASLGGEFAGRYRPAAYRDDLPTIMLAADLGVMRAGASTLGELPAAGLPSLLVPAGYAGGHQRANAQWLVDGGAAQVLEEEQLDALGERVAKLLGDEEQLARMRVAAGKLARPDAADAIARIIEGVARR